MLVNMFTLYTFFVLLLVYMLMVYTSYNPNCNNMNGTLYSKSRKYRKAKTTTTEKITPKCSKVGVCRKKKTFKY